MTIKDREWSRGAHAICVLVRIHGKGLSSKNSLSLHNTGCGPLVTLPEASLFMDTFCASALAIWNWFLASSLPTKCCTVGKGVFPSSKRTDFTSRTSSALSCGQLPASTTSSFSAGRSTNAALSTDAKDLGPKCRRVRFSKSKHDFGPLSQRLKKRMRVRLKQFAPKISEVRCLHATRYALSPLPPSQTMRSSGD